MKIRVIAINPHTQQVIGTVVDGLDEMQALVGGWIERGHTLPNGDELYVHEEGLLGDMSEQRFFTIGELGLPAQFFAGKAFVIGPANDDGENTHIISTVGEIVKHIEYFRAEEIP